MGKFFRFVRIWHKWVGAVAAVAMLTFSVTGILLNHKEFFGLKPAVLKAPAAKPGAVYADNGNFKPMKFDTRLTVSDLPVSLQRAIDLTYKKVGTKDIHKVELRNEKGTGFVYKVQTGKKPHTEVFVSAVTGDSWVTAPTKGKKIESFIMDLHHFNFSDGRFVIVADLFAGCLAALTATGLWLFVKQELAIRRSRSMAKQLRQPQE